MAPRYGAILADPPWHEVTWSRKGMGRSAAAHYDTMSIDAIKDLPVKDLAARDCALFLWVTWPILESVFSADLFAVWGFHYSSNAWLWIKRTKNGKSKDGRAIPRVRCAEFRHGELKTYAIWRQSLVAHPA